jgi:hypothetical protein
MNSKLLFAIGVVILFILSCEAPSERITRSHDLHIIIQALFDNDQVRVDLDNQTVFDGTVTTGSIVAVAEWLTLESEEGMHLIRFFINGEFGAETRFELNTTHYVIIYRNGVTKEVGIWVTEDPPEYD